MALSTCSSGLGFGRPRQPACSGATSTLSGGDCTSNGLGICTRTAIPRLPVLAAGRVVPGNSTAADLAALALCPSRVSGVHNDGRGADLAKGVRLAPLVRLPSRAEDPHTRHLLHQGHVRDDGFAGERTKRWLESHTGVSYATLRRHYGKWMPLEHESELQRFARSVRRSSRRKLSPQTARRRDNFHKILIRKRTSSARRGT